jgi:dTDP-L-rhamnose 4-epimerase
MRILITGGAGFIGSNLAIALIKKGHTVTVLDNLSKQIHGDIPENSVLYKSIKDSTHFIKGDVTDKDAWKTALSGQDAVVHLAAETGTGQSMYEIEKYCKVNIDGTAILLELLTNDPSLKVKKVIIASSRAIYGEGKYRDSNGGFFYPEAREEEDLSKGNFELRCPLNGRNAEVVATDEDSKIHPSSVYGITKQNQEQMVLTVCKALQIPAVAFRYQNVYGPGQSLSNPYTGILSIFSTLIKNGKDINIFEDGKESRDFVYIDDVVNATILGIEKDAANYNTYNVGSGVPTDVLSVAETLREKYNSNVNISINGNYRVGDIRHNFADLTRIKNDLGFAPEFDFLTGISKFAAWVDQQEIQKSKYDESLDEMKAKGLYK